VSQTPLERGQGGKIKREKKGGGGGGGSKGSQGRFTTNNGFQEKKKGKRIYFKGFRLLFGPARGEGRKSGEKRGKKGSACGMLRTRCCFGP